MPPDFVALLPKVAAARKEVGQPRLPLWYCRCVYVTIMSHVVDLLRQLGKEWTSRKTLSVRSGGIQAMKSSDARQAVRCAYAYACALMVLGVPITVAFCHNNRLLQLGFRPLHPQKLFNDAGQHT